MDKIMRNRWPPSPVEAAWDKKYSIEVHSKLWEKVHEEERLFPFMLDISMGYGALFISDLKIAFTVLCHGQNATITSLYGVFCWSATLWQPKMPLIT